ncbi:MAG: uracil-DNA glycosylase [Thermoprotei archaeon]
MINAIDELNNQILACSRCPLAYARKNAVLGEGKFSSLMLIGEAPGKEEDEKGRPFVGRAGKLLESLLRVEGLARNDVYITNVVKCRPPRNRKPSPSEIAACMPYLHKEIELVAPKAILLMGATAASALVQGVGVFSSRQKNFEYNGIPVRVTLHPAAALRNPRFVPLIKFDLETIKPLL